MSSKKEMRTLFRELERQGFTVETRRSGHVLIKSPKGGIYFTGSSPSDYRVLRQVEQDLVKFGYIKSRHRDKRKRRRGTRSNA